MRSVVCTHCSYSTVLLVLAVITNCAADVPRGRLQRLSRGTNITSWFSVWGPKQYRDYMSDDEVGMIRRVGLRHVRLPFEPSFLYDPAHPGTPIHDHLALVEEAIQRLNAHDLAVVLDPHNIDQKRIQDDPQWSDGFPVFWGALAAQLRHISPDMLIFEVVNEPVFDGLESAWSALQEKVVAAIRKSAPEHTIICTGPNWGGVDGLLKLRPLADSNVVYSFHFYEPFTFTHQGATWTGRVPPLLKGIPYPSDPEVIEAPLSQITDSEARGWVVRYGKERWDRARLRERLGKVLAWGQEHKVPLYCGEFGVYTPNTPPESRRNWFRDFASVLKESGVGYAVWGWDETFGFGRKKEGDRIVIDPVPVEALGLKMP